MAVASRHRCDRLENECLTFDLPTRTCLRGCFDERSAEIRELDEPLLRVRMSCDDVQPRGRPLLGRGRDRRDDLRRKMHGRDLRDSHTQEQARCAVTPPPTF